MGQQEIYDILLKKGGYMSGAEICKKVEGSTGSVYSALKKLRKAQYIEIMKVRKNGVQKWLYRIKED